MLDASKSWFHTCKCFSHCLIASRDDVVYINPVTISKSKWQQYLTLTESKLCVVQPVTVLVYINSFVISPSLIHESI